MNVAAKRMFERFIHSQIIDFAPQSLHPIQQMNGGLASIAMLHLAASRDGESSRFKRDRYVTPFQICKDCLEVIVRRPADEIRIKLENGHMGGNLTPRRIRLEKAHEICRACLISSCRTEGRNPNARFREGRRTDKDENRRKEPFHAGSSPAMRVLSPPVANATMGVLRQ